MAMATEKSNCGKWRPRGEKGGAGATIVQQTTAEQYSRLMLMGPTVVARPLRTGGVGLAWRQQATSWSQSPPPRAHQEGFRPHNSQSQAAWTPQRSPPILVELTSETVETWRTFSKVGTGRPQRLRPHPPSQVQRPLTTRIDSPWHLRWNPWGLSLSGLQAPWSQVTMGRYI